MPGVSPGLGNPESSRGTGHHQAVSGRINVQTMSKHEIKTIVLRKAIAKDFETLPAVCGANDDQLTVDRNPALIFHRRYKPGGATIARMHRDGEAERRGFHL